MKTVTFEDGEHDALRDLVSWAYSSNYYHNRFDTDTFDSMAEEVEAARNRFDYSSC